MSLISLKIVFFFFVCYKKQLIWVYVLYIICVMYDVFFRTDYKWGSKIHLFLFSLYHRFKCTFFFKYIALFLHVLIVGTYWLLLLVLWQLFTDIYRKKLYICVVQPLMMILYLFNTIYRFHYNWYQSKELTLETYKWIINILNLLCTMIPLNSIYNYIYMVFS